MKSTVDEVFSLIKNEKSKIPYKPVIGSDYKQELDSELAVIKGLDSTLSAFSKTDINILRLLYENKASDEISEEMYLSTDSIKYHIKKIYRYLNVHNRTELKNILDENLIDVKSL